MCSSNCDYKNDDSNVGYMMIIDKQVNIYEQILSKNEQKYNQYKVVEQLIDISDNDNTNHPKINKPKKLEKHINIYSNQYKVKLSRLCQLDCSNPKRIRFTSYICKWSKCTFTSSKKTQMINHLLDKHINNRQFRNYRRSFVRLNEYIYKCSHDRCGYETEGLSSIFKHVKTTHKNWKCSVRECGKVFPTKIEMILHKKHHLCNFKLLGGGACSLDNIKKFYKRRKVIDGSEKDKLYFRYICKWSNCMFSSFKNEVIEEHIHNLHTCPHITQVLDKADGKQLTHKHNTRKKAKK